MANPNNAVGTNGAFGGRTSVNALNDVLGAFTGRGILSGWNCSPKSGLTVQLGGNGSVRDVAIAEDATGNKTTVNNISQAPVSVTLNNAPASNSRIDLVVAYIEDSPNGSGETDNPDVVNVLVVSGSAASTPVAPNDSAIRTAITADGASGATAYYVVLAQIRLATGTTDIDSTMITQGTPVAFGEIGLSEGVVGSDAIADGAVTSDKVDFATIQVPFSDGDNITTTGKTLASYTVVKPGKYFITVNADVNLLGHDVGNGRVMLAKNGNVVQEVYFNNPQGVFFFGGVQLSAITDCMVGDAISVFANSGDSPFAIPTAVSRSNLNLVRIG